MKTYALKAAALAALILPGTLVLRAQPTASPTSFSFTYQVGSSTLPSAGKLTATLPKGLSTSTYILTASVTPANSWLTVTPGSGTSPLSLTVTVNPTTLSPGSYTGTITVGTSPGTGTTLVPVTLSISNPPSSIIVTPSSTTTNYTPGISGANPILAYNYTTGQANALPASAELDVASNGGIIPFTVAATSGSKTNTWLRINVSNQLPGTSTSGVALSGSYVPIFVTIDYTALVALNVGPYSGTITFTNAASGAVAATVSVALNVSAGSPSISTIFPSSVPAAQSSGRVPPVITIYGDNFFTNSSVQLTPDGAQPLPALTPTLLSRQVLQVTLSPSYLTRPGSFTLTVANPSTLTNPAPQQSSVPFAVTDGTVPQISAILNSASYLHSAAWKGTAGLDPVPAAPLPGNSAVSPREIIAIFGQSIGPAHVVAASASTSFPATFPTQVIFSPTGAVPPTTTNGTAYEVLFKFGTDPSSLTAPVVKAPLIMVSSNQINAVAPVPPASASVYTLPAPNAWVQVTETTATAVQTTDWFPVTYVPEVPGVFTFGGLGLGQAAVLNYDPNTGYSINSSKNAAAKGATISLYVTGLGDLVSGSLITVTDSSSPKQSTTVPFGLIVNPTPAVTASLTATAASFTMTQSSLFAAGLQATGAAPPYLWSVSSGLPPGLTLSSSGLLSGTPTTAGSYTMVVSVTDSAGISPVSAIYPITISAPTVTVTSTGLVPGVVGVVYPQTTLTATGGKAPYTWSATGLPAGMALSPAGVLSGTPAAGGSSTVAVTATDSSTPGVASAPVNLTLNVLLSGMTITTPVMPAAVSGIAIPITTMTQQGGTSPIAWSAVGLPTGLTITAGGIISGTPTVSGAYSITITATDSSGSPQVASVTYIMNIAAPVSITTPSPLPTGSQTVTYPAVVLQATGGTPPYTWNANGLPLGMTLTTTGVLGGVPSSAFYLPLPDGAVALGPVYVADNTYRVEINGQAAVTSYAGASQGSVAGLTQINAIVPPTAPTGAAIPLIVYIGRSNVARSSQLSVTLAVQ